MGRRERDAGVNILMVTAYPPVLHMHGGGVRMYHNIRILSRKHDVHVLSFVGSDAEMEALRSVAPVCASIRGVRRIPDFRPHWLSLSPFMVREFSTPEMHRAVDGTLNSARIDLLQCEYLQMAQFRRAGMPCVLTAHEAMSKNAWEAFTGETRPLEKMRLFYRWMQMLRYEIQQVRKFHGVITMTEEDASYLRSYAAEARIRAVPIGIDPEEFLPLQEEPFEKSVVLFVGNFHHSPNVEAADFLVHRVAPRFPEVTFVIPGSPVPDTFHKPQNVLFPGYVADTRQLYRRPNTIVMTPLFSGTGQRVKLLEAFSMGCPVVTTRLGAMGFPIQDGVQALFAQTADEFGGALRRLLDYPDERVRLGREARRMILEKFTWARIGEELVDAVEDIAQGSAAR